MNSLLTICAGLATVSLAYIAVSLEPIAQQARTWNYCVEHQVAYFIEQEAKEQSTLGLDQTKLPFVVVQHLKLMPLLQI